eukprot:TRINITY_DN8824_c0_g2_i1.p1 TRINITY_DN8824_c0_g2~~TRINITY_DN8824_c0_g2_i1.p1  ORF type:complete len:239 (+),score=62.31 TRINITY_DN8824_c0_g2_i1:165-881(+)
MDPSSAPASSARSPWQLPQVRAAPCALFTLILLQVPLFSSPCRTGICSAPLEVMVGQLSASFPLPRPLLKALLLPGAVYRRVHGAAFRAEAFALPAWGSLLAEYRLDDMEQHGDFSYRLEVMAGCYFVVVAAAASLVNPRVRFGVLGFLLLFFGLLKEGMDWSALWDPFLVALGLSASESSSPPAVTLAPCFLPAVALMLLSLRVDPKKVARLGSGLTRGFRRGGGRGQETSTKEKAN